MSGLLPRLMVCGCLIWAISGCGQSLEEIAESSKEKLGEVGQKMGEVGEKVGESAKSVTETVKESVNNATESVKQVAQVAGKMKLQMGQPVDVSGCYIRVLPVPNRNTVVQISSYNDAKNEKFPSVFLRSETSVDATSLAGQRLQAVAFVMPSSDGPVWQSVPEKPLEIEFSQTPEGEIAGQVKAGELVNVLTGEVVPVTGSFQGPAPE